MYPARNAPRVLAENRKILLVLYGDSSLSTDLELIAVGALQGPLHKCAQCPSDSHRTWFAQEYAVASKNSSFALNVIVSTSPRCTHLVKQLALVAGKIEAATLVRSISISAALTSSRSKANSPCLTLSPACGPRQTILAPVRRPVVELLPVQRSWKLRGSPE